MLRAMKKFVMGLLIVAPLVLLFYMYPLAGGSQQERPVAPGRPNVVDVPEGLEVSWRPVPGALYYTVFWGTERTDYKNLFNTSQSRVMLTGLRKGELYYIAVTTWTPRGESNYSNEQIVVYDNVPSHAKTHLARANELMQTGAYPEALAHISAAVKLDPTDPEAYRDRALFHEKIARPDLARQDYATAEKLYKKRPISLVPTKQPGSY